METEKNAVWGIFRTVGDDALFLKPFDCREVVGVHTGGLIHIFLPFDFWIHRVFVGTESEVKTYIYNNSTSKGCKYASLAENCKDAISGFIHAILHRIYEKSCETFSKRAYRERGRLVNTEELKKLKSESKLTTKQISELSGIPESTISRVLSGQTDNPTFDTVCAIVKAMGGSLDKIVDPQADLAQSDASPLIALYEKIIAQKEYYIKVLITFCVVLVSVLILFVLCDLLNGTRGFIRY